jgi:hypothetical protein
MSKKKQRPQHLRCLHKKLLATKGPLFAWSKVEIQNGQKVWLTVGLCVDCGALAATGMGEVKEAEPEPTGVE